MKNIALTQTKQELVGCINHQSTRLRGRELVPLSPPSTIHHVPINFELATKKHVRPAVRPSRNPSSYNHSRSPRRVLQRKECSPYIGKMGGGCTYSPQSELSQSTLLHSLHYYFRVGNLTQDVTLIHSFIAGVGSKRGKNIAAGQPATNRSTVLLRCS